MLGRGRKEDLLPVTILRSPASSPLGSGVKLIVSNWAGPCRESPAGGGLRVGKAGDHLLLGEFQEVHDHQHLSLFHTSRIRV